MGRPWYMNPSTNLSIIILYISTNISISILDLSTNLSISTLLILMKPFCRNLKLSFHTRDYILRLTLMPNNPGIMLWGIHRHMCFVCRCWSVKKGVIETKKVIMFLVSPSLSLDYWKLNKDIWMNSNQVYNFI